MYQIPILLIVFNRPDHVEKLLNKLKVINPQKIYVYIDRPRTGNANDLENCQKVLSLISEFSCPEKYIKRPASNVGCKIAITTAIDWLFENEEMGIILEDDCHPSESFFEFCKEGLIRFKDNEKIFNICGTYYGNSQKKNTWYLSQLNGIWGWAIWKRSWVQIDFNLRDYKNPIFSKKVNQYFKNRSLRNWLLSYIDDEYYKRSNIWSPYLIYAKIMTNSYTLSPYVNLVENVGLMAGVNSDGKSFINLAEAKANELIKPDYDLPVYDYEADKNSFKITSKEDPRRSVKVKAHRIISKILYKTTLIRIYWFFKKLK